MIRRLPFPLVCALLLAGDPAFAQRAPKPSPSPAPSPAALKVAVAVAPAVLPVAFPVLAISFPLFAVHVPVLEAVRMAGYGVTLGVPLAIAVALGYLWWTNWRHRIRHPQQP